MVIIFVVLLFTVAQVYLGDLVVGKNEQIQNLEKTIEIQDETIVEQDLSLSDKELALIERQEVISQLDTELEILDEEIKIKQSEISEKENLLTAKDELIFEIYTAKDEISLQDEILKKKMKLLTLDDLINKQALDITELNEIIAELLKNYLYL